MKKDCSVGAHCNSTRYLTAPLGALLLTLLLLLLTGPAGAQTGGSCVQPPTGLVSWWTAEGAATDVLGTNNGARLNGAGFGAGEVGQAFSFSGNLQCVSVPYSRSLVATNYSVEAWVKPLAQVSDAISQDCIIGQAYGWELVARPGSAGIKAVFLFATSTAKFYEVVSTNELPIGQFSHVVGSWDGTTLRLYINGVLDSQSVPAATPADLGYGFYIGGYYILSGSTVTYSGQYFNGLIDEASYYSRALSGTEIAGLYNAGSAGKCRAGVPPSIQTQPQSQTVTNGANASFSVVAVGTTPLSYQWRFNGARLPGATASVLALSNVQATNAGTYDVAVTNLYGSVNSTGATLTVLGNGNGGCTPPPSGLVSWWPAEGEALDVAGTNNGVLINGATFGAGEVGQAFSFNGTTQCVAVPYSRGLVATHYSVEAWVKPLSQVSDTINQDLIVGQAYGWHLVARTGSSGVAGAFGFATSATTFYDVVSASELSLGQFSHVVGTWDGTTLRLYINGVLNAQRTVAATPVDLGYGFYIGGFYIQSPGGVSYSGQYFNGLIDEASYYGRALDGAEIASLYSAGSAGKCRAGVPPSIQTQPQSQTTTNGANASFSVVAVGTTPLSYQWRFNGTAMAGATGTALALNSVHFTNAGTYTVVVTNLYGATTSAPAILTVVGTGACQPPPEGLVSWWPAEGSALDAVGTNNGVLLPGAVFVTGEVGEAFSFNGTTQYVRVPYSPSLAATNYSVEAWIKPLAQVSDPINQDSIIEQAYGWQLVVRPGTSGVKVAFLFATSTTSFYSVVGAAELPLGQFSHVVGTWNGTALRLYINGVLSAQAVPGATPVDLHYDFYIGGAYSQAGGFSGQYFNGLIDELSYYKRALNEAEVANLYNAASAGKCRIQSPPSIETQPQNQVVPAGNTASFSIVAAGTSPLSYQWHFNGTSITGATGPGLTVANVQLANVGTYEVTVTNLYGSTNSAGATLTLLGSGACAPPPPGLVSWWRAEGTAADALGPNSGGNHGAGFAPGEVGQAFSFNGTTQYVIVPYSQTLAATNYSVEAWVKPLTQVSDSLNQDQIIGQAYGWQLVARTGTSGVKVAFLFATSTTSFYGVQSAYELPIGQFSHVAGTWDGTTLRLYANGVLNASSVPHATPVDLGYDIYIGGSYRQGMFSGQYFNGLIDEASYYNRALNAAEIQAIYLTGSAGKCTPAPLSIVACAANRTMSAGANCTALAPDLTSEVVASDASGPVTVSQNPPAGAALGLGANTVTFTVRDSSSNAASCTSTLTVADTTPPTISCPASRVIEFQDEKGAVATYTVTASDLCSAVSLVVNPPSGSLFPVGVRSVLAQATDAGSNTAQCSFTVTVLGAQGVKSNVLAELKALPAKGFLADDFNQKLQNALQHLAGSLDPAYWVDQTHLQPRSGNTAMNEEKLCAGTLQEIMQSKKCPVDPAVLQGFIDRIVKCDRLLAVICIQEAARAGLNPKKVAEDFEMVAKGDREAAAGHYENAIEHYRNAWRHALQLRLQVAVNPDGSTRVQFVGNNSQSYRIEVSGDMVTWVALGTCKADADGNVQFTDPNTASHPLRFYRAVEQ